MITEQYLKDIERCYPRRAEWPVIHDLMDEVRALREELEIVPKPTRTKVLRLPSSPAWTSEDFRVCAQVDDNESVRFISPTLPKKDLPSFVTWLRALFGD